MSLRPKAGPSKLLARYRARRADRKALRAERRQRGGDRWDAAQRAQGDAFGRSRHT